MVDKFGSVMIYVNDVRKVADFWIEKVNFSEVQVMEMEGKLLGVELMPYDNSDATITLYDKEFVKANSDVPDLATPSILFSTNDINDMQAKLKAAGVEVSDVTDMGGMLSINFPDPENNYFAVKQI